MNMLEIDFSHDNVRESLKVFSSLINNNINSFLDKMDGHFNSKIENELIRKKVLKLINQAKEPYKSELLDLKPTSDIEPSSDDVYYKITISNEGKNILTVGKSFFHYFRIDKLVSEDTLDVINTHPDGTVFDFNRIKFLNNNMRRLIKFNDLFGFRLCNYIKTDYDISLSNEIYIPIERESFFLSHKKGNKVNEEELTPNHFRRIK